MQCLLKQHIKFLRSVVNCASNLFEIKAVNRKEVKIRRKLKTRNCFVFKICSLQIVKFCVNCDEIVVQKCFDNNKKQGNQLFKGYLRT